MKSQKTQSFISHEPPDFSLVLGGPLFQFFLRSHLATPALELLGRRIVFLSMFAWLPRLLLAFAEGKLWGGCGLPFLKDIEMQVRFLITLPLLIVAELVVHQRIRLTVGEFIDRDIVRKDVLPKFKELIASALKWRNSMIAELMLLLLVFVGGHYLWSMLSGIQEIGAVTGTWYSTRIADGTKLSLAGYWYIFVSGPMYQFLLIRWYYRMFIWARFLFQTSRLKLHLIPTHPDRAAGLGFLGQSSAAFAPLLMAHGALLAGLFANPIFFAGAKLVEFKGEVFVMVLFLLVLVLGPLLFFSPLIARAKRAGLREYGILASRYVNEFDVKWVHSSTTDTEPFIGSADIQSLADLGNSYQLIRDIKPLPFGRETVVQLIGGILIPILPLVLTMIPLEVLLKKILGAIF